MNYFELFNLNTDFHVDLAHLAVTYQKLQQLTHPDKFAHTGEAERLRMVQKNAQVNDAYQVLKTPLSRAEHMLELRGVELKHEQRTMQDSHFLMQQMEWREGLDEVDSAADPIAALENLDDEIKSNIDSHLGKLSKHLLAQSEDGNQAAADEVRKLKFLYKLREEIARKEDALSDF